MKKKRKDESKYMIARYVNGKIVWNRREPKIFRLRSWLPKTGIDVVNISGKNKKRGKKI